MFDVRDSFVLDNRDAFSFDDHVIFSRKCFHLLRFMKDVQASREMREIMKGERAERGRRFTYGDKERVLMQHLGQHSTITVDVFANMANIPRKIASRTLVLLVLANILDVHPDEVVDHYTTRYDGS